MNEAKTNETKPKKMVSSKVAVTLGVFIIILVVGLVIARSSYFPTINSHFSTASFIGMIMSLKSKVASLQGKITSLNV